MNKNTAVLSSDELIQLGKHEETIEQGLKTFIEVGLALMDIRERRLYRERFSTFEDYCRQRWGMVASRARQLITASTIVANIKSVTDVTPENEAQTRPLAKLSPDQQAEAWQRAVETAPNGKITGPHVESVVNQILGVEQKPTNILHSSESSDWYTPAEYIAAVKEVMGGIDLDPASCDFANQTVGATSFYSIEDDGLSQSWWGRVFLNPPYGKTAGESNQRMWSDALIWAYQERMVEEAILLVNATPGNRWFKPLWNYPICFVDHRIQFYTSTGLPDRATHSNCFVYMGKNLSKFAEVFIRFGDVAVRYNPASKPF